jgi:hypothetical protein
LLVSGLNDLKRAAGPTGRDYAEISHDLARKVPAKRQPMGS